MRTRALAVCLSWCKAYRSGIKKHERKKKRRAGLKPGNRGSDDAIFGVSKTYHKRTLLQFENCDGHGRRKACGKQSNIRSRILPAF
ncbi:hypothetical protein BDW71DRAFT_124586 [Aspergillus fruticulosus]